MRNPSLLVLLAATLSTPIASADPGATKGTTKTGTKVAALEGEQRSRPEDQPQAQYVAKDAAEKPPVAAPIGLNLDIGWASSYNFRGWNFYGAGKQLDQHGVLTPSARYVVGESGFAIQYVSAYPSNGGNGKELFDGGYAGEQDLILSYTRAISKEVSVTGSMIAYVFPFARKDVAGTAAPTYLEPGAALTYSTVVDLSLSVSYFAGIQDVLAAYRYLYIRPAVQKKVVVSTRATLQGDLGIGYKIPTQEMSKDNRVDVGADVKTVITLGSTYLAPGINYAWSNFAGMSGHMVFGSLNAGLDL